MLILARKMEADVLKVVLSHLQHITAVGEEDVAAVLVLGHVLKFALLELLKLLCVIALDPAGLVEA